MKNLLALGLVLSTLVILMTGGVAKADVAHSQFTVDASMVLEEGQAGSILKLDVQDAKPKSGVCPYYAKNVEYLPSVHVLNIEVYQENCRNDAYGVSQGQVYWVVPKSLQNGAADLQILVNQNLAASLSYSSRSKTFVINGTGR
jgi:hypothetical protein